MSGTKYWTGPLSFALRSKSGHTGTGERSSGIFPHSNTTGKCTWGVVGAGGFFIHEIQFLTLLRGTSNLPGLGDDDDNDSDNLYLGGS